MNDPKDELPGRDCSLVTAPTFLITVYKEPAQLSWCLTALRKSYPHAPVIIVSDGDADPQYEITARRFGAEYRPSERLKIPSKGASYLKRMFDELLRTPNQHLIKIDPDTHVRRPLHRLPQGDFCGTLLNKGTSLEHVQGGCQIFSLTACRKIIESEVLEDPVYLDLDEWCRHPVLRNLLRNYSSRTGLLNVDFMLMHAMSRINIRAAGFEEVGCFWTTWRRVMFRLSLRDYAFTHPHKIGSWI